MRSNYVYVTHEMDVHTDLLGRLWRDGVLEEDEKIEIDVLRSPTKRCEKLLSILRRKTQKQYEVFVEALRATNQSHVADVLRLEGSSSFCDENTTRFSRLSLAAFRGHSPAVISVTWVPNIWTSCLFHFHYLIPLGVWTPIFGEHRRHCLLVRQLFV